MHANIESSRITARIVELGIVPTRAAEHALRATLGALSEHLADDERRALAAALGSWASFVLHTPARRGAFAIEDLYEGVRRRERITSGFAREHAQIVFRALGDLMPRETCARLERALPPVATLFAHGDAAPAPPHSSPSVRHHTLATGRPGSAHPISESPPPSAHAHSVARSDDPHGDSKLSSAHGLTQESVDESLANAKPDARRTIANAKD